jgi:unsaturated rhamnogalacturonyl hydrolase
VELYGGPVIKTFRSVIVAVSITSAAGTFFPAASDEFSPDSITAIMRKVANYRLKNGGASINALWEGGAYFTGVMAIYRHTGDQQYLDAIKAWGQAHNWQPNGGTGAGNPDDQCCCQTYCEAYLLNPVASNSYQYQPWLDTYHQRYEVNGVRGWRHVWYWCDALFMAPPAVAMLYPIMGNNRKYLDTLVKCWWDVADTLYSKQYHLYWQQGFKAFRVEPNGKPQFWGPGEAWVVGGQARVLKYMPLSYPGRDSLAVQFRDQCTALAACRMGNGLWGTSLLDTVAWPVTETSGSAFIGFAITWGINNGILDRAVFEPVARKAWSGLVKKINPSTGALTYCQVWAQDPGTPNQGSTNLEGEGAVMLAGEEMYKLVTGQVGVAGKNVRSSFDVKEPRAACRVVPSFQKSVELPADAAGYVIYTLQGEKVLEERNNTPGNRPAFVNLPAARLGGVFVIKFVNR